jgi:hypothetical protein
MANVKVESKDLDGNEKVIYVKKPSPKETAEAKIYSNIFATRLLNTKDTNGKPAIILRSQVDERLRALDVWSEKDEQDIKALAKEISTNERKLLVGGIKKSEGRAIAIEIIKLRQKQDEIFSKRGELDRITLESQIEQASFDCLVSLCLLSENGQRIFSSTEDYLNNVAQPYCYDGALKLSEIIYGKNEDPRKKLVEWQFLQKYGFVNENLEFVKDGKKIDAETGLFVNDKGRYVDEFGNYINASGERINEDGTPYVEHSAEFIDD